MTTSPHGPLRVGVGGPVGTGKTALMDALCKHFRDHYDIAAITNDIYTKEDAEFLTRAGSLPVERIMGIETGGCPHTAIREDASINLAGVADLRQRFPDLDLILIESRRRQSRRDLQSGTGGSDDLRHRRFGRRQDPPQGRPGHHAQRPAGHQQDRPCPVCRRQPGGHGPRREEDARRPAVRVRQRPRRQGRRRHRRLHRKARRPAAPALAKHPPVVGHCSGNREGGQTWPTTDARKAERCGAN